MKNIFRLHLILFVVFSIMSCGDSSAPVSTSTEASSSALLIEKPQLTFGFIKLTDMAPLAIAKELGYFQDEGLFVTNQSRCLKARRRIL